LSANQPLIWITGAAGFLGSRAAEHFLARGWRVAGIARSPSCRERGFTDWVKEGIRPHSLAELVRRQGRPDAVFHAAGGGLVSAAQADPLRDFNDNVATTALLLDLLRKEAPDCLFILASSAAVYGSCEAVRLSESRVPSPMSVYGQHKWMAEQLCAQEQSLSGLRTVAIRYFSLFGPGLRKQIVWDLSCRIQSREQQITLFGTGAETRDFLFVDDAVGLLDAVVSAGGRAPAVVNGGRGIPVTMRELATAVADGFGSGVSIEFNGLERAGDPKYLVALPDRMNALGFQPKTALAEGLGQFRAWFEGQLATAGSDR
jgi:UDP-glucose 4-epimerase